MDVDDENPRSIGNKTMRRKDLHEGVVVWHVSMYNWGKGIVIKTREKDNFGFPTSLRYRVQWTSNSKTPQMWCRAMELRKTPK